MIGLLWVAMAIAWATVWVQSVRLDVANHRLAIVEEAIRKLKELR